MSDVYILFCGMALVTVASPGPGVLMTLDNAVRRGWLASMHGVAGLALGAAIMAGLCSAGVGAAIHASPSLFVILKYCGVAYLFYLAYSAWRASYRPDAAHGNTASGGRATGLAPATEPVRNGLLFVRGTLLQTSNPKSLLFFLSVLPQFVAGEAGSGASALPRLMAAILIYCIALLLVHAIYAGLASRAKGFLGRPAIQRVLTRISALVFAGFGVTMLASGF